MLHRPGRVKTNAGCSRNSLADWKLVKRGITLAATRVGLVSRYMYFSEVETALVLILEFAGFSNITPAAMLLGLLGDGR